MYEVLLALDGDEDRARTLAHAVTDLPEDPANVRAVLFHVFTGDNPNNASVHQVASVRRARDQLEAAGAEVVLDESSGPPAREILAAAGEHDVDLVTVAGRQRSPAGKALLGSVSQEVLLGSERPVLFVGERDVLEE
ncbi:MAG: universal stress protein [Halobacteriales archaeon]